MENDSYKRLAIAGYMDNTSGKCEICSHKYKNVDDFIERDSVFMGRKEDIFKVACKKCFEKGASNGK